jgi:hypothetical protein
MLRHVKYHNSSRCRQFTGECLPSVPTTSLYTVIPFGQIIFEIFSSVEFQFKIIVALPRERERESLDDLPANVSGLQDCHIRNQGLESAALLKDYQYRLVVAT